MYSKVGGSVTSTLYESCRVCYRERETVKGKEEEEEEEEEEEAFPCSVTGQTRRIRPLEGGGGGREGGRMLLLLLLLLLLLPVVWRRSVCCATCFRWRLGELRCVAGCQKNGMKEEKLGFILFFFWGGGGNGMLFLSFSVDT